MELSGNLKKFPLPKVLQFLNMDQATGELRLFRGKRQITLLLEEGNIVDVRDSQNPLPGRMRAVVLASGKMQENEWDIVAEEVKTRLMPMSKTLTDSNYLSHNEMNRLLKRVYFEALMEALQLPDGRYEFEHKDEILSTSELPDPISVNSLMLNLARQEDEWAALKKIVPSREAVFGRTESVEDATWEQALDSMSAEEQRIARTIDGYSTAGMIADITFATDFDVANTISELVRRGMLARVIEQEAAYAKSKPKTFFSINIGPLAQSMIYITISLVLLFLVWSRAIAPMIADWEEQLSSFESAGLDRQTANAMRLSRLLNGFYLYLKEYGESPSSLQVLLREGYAKPVDLDIVGGGHFQLKVIGLKEDAALIEGVDEEGNPIPSLTTELFIR